jgi:hypothetical protein
VTLQRCCNAVAQQLNDQLPLLQLVISPASWYASYC